MASISSATPHMHNQFMGNLFFATSTDWTTSGPYGSNLYIGLFTSNPGGGPYSDTPPTEVSASGTNYSRVAVPRANTSSPTAGWNTSGTSPLYTYTNTADIVFPTPGGTAWGTIFAAGIFDAATSGNLLYVALLGTSKTVGAGDGAPRILAGQLQISRAT